MERYGLAGSTVGFFSTGTHYSDTLQGTRDDACRDLPVTVGWAVAAPSLQRSVEAGMWRDISSSSRAYGSFFLACQRVNLTANGVPQNIMNLAQSARNASTNSASELFWHFCRSCWITAIFFHSESVPCHFFSLLCWFLVCQGARWLRPVWNSLTLHGIQRGALGPIMCTFYIDASGWAQNTLTLG